MSETVKIITPCGQVITGKVWKQGGSFKCPDNWAVNTYPRPDTERIIKIVRRECQGCEKITPFEEIPVSLFDDDRVLKSTPREMAPKEDDKK